MRVGLIDVDGKNFPNIALMKISAACKKEGDMVEWYQPFGERYDVIFMSKVFSFTPDYDLCINADRVLRGGTGYCINLRWRGGDPWTAQLVPLLPNGRFGNYLEWEFLDVSDYVHDGYENLEKECIRLIEKRFKNIIWHQRNS